MLPFDVKFKTGIPVYEQVVYAVKKAIVSGQMLPGDSFPSVRTLSQELRINPNTAYKIVSILVEEQLLSVTPGVGTVVAKARPATKEQRTRLLKDEVEHLIVEAKKISLDVNDVIEAVELQWDRLTKEQS